MRALSVAGGHSQQAGFTLLEVVIAIAIFALLGLGTYRMLDSVLRADEATRASEQALRELTRAFVALDRDLAQTVARGVRDPYGDKRAALIGELGARDGRAAIEFTRHGWFNPLGLARAQLQRVRWRLNDDGELQRTYWTVLDQAVDSQPREQTLLTGVESLTLRFLDAEGEWQAQWPPGDANLREAEQRLLLPQAVELTLEHRRYGELSRLYRLPDTPPAEPKPSEQPPPAEPPSPELPTPDPAPLPTASVATEPA